MEMDNVISKLFGQLTSHKKLQDTILPVFDKLEDFICKQTASYYTHKFHFKSKHDLEDRVLIYENLAKKYPNKIPVVVEFAFDDIKESRKLLLDYDEYVIRMIATIKKGWSQSVYILTDTNKCLMSSQSVGEAYKQYLCDKSAGEEDVEDKIMYLVVYTENTFG
jgi:hypothetical protein